MVPLPPTTVLRSVVKFKLGHNFRGKIAEDSSGEGIVLQPKHISNRSFISWTPISLLANGIGTQHFLKEGEILFVSKGAKLSAVKFDGFHEQAIASSSFTRIQLTSGDIHPDFLTWWLNHQDVHQFIEQQTGGALLRSVSKKVLAKVPVPILKMEVQQKIVDLDRVRRKQSELVLLREKMKNELTEALIEKIMKS